MRASALLTSDARLLRPATLAQYSKIIDAWLVPHVGGVQVAKMSPKQAQQLVEILRAQGGRNGTPLSSRSVQLAIVVLKAATTWAVETRIVGRDPLLGFKRPRSKASKDATAAWTTEEARSFLASVADDRLMAAWSLLLTRGLRRGELAGLRWDAIDLDGRSLRITRTRVLVDGQPSTPSPRPTRASAESRSTTASWPRCDRTEHARAKSVGVPARPGRTAATSSRTS